MSRLTKRHHNAALAFANRVRKQLGKRPVKRLQKGVPNNGRLCPIARTITRDETNIFVSDIDNGDGRYVAHAEVPGIETVYGGVLVGEFIRAFDKGAVPELVSRR